jgi:septum formation protein
VSGKNPSFDLILASASPRRAEILSQIGVLFTVIPAYIDESVLPNEDPQVYVRRVALAKAVAVSADSGPLTPVLAADTAVVIDSSILGKPTGIEHARSMLELLSGRWHEVVSGVAIMHEDVSLISVRTRVKFRPILEHEIEAYWSSGEPADKAGSYAIQGIGGAFVERIEGSYSNVVGLPMVETSTLLNKYSIAHALGSGAVREQI